MSDKAMENLIRNRVVVFENVKLIWKTGTVASSYKGKVNLKEYVLNFLIDKGNMAWFKQIKSIVGFHGWHDPNKKFEDITDDDIFDMLKVAQEGDATKYPDVVGKYFFGKTIKSTPYFPVVASAQLEANLKASGTPEEAMEATEILKRVSDPKNLRWGNTVNIGVRLEQYDPQQSDGGLAIRGRHLKVVVQDLSDSDPLIDIDTAMEDWDRLKNQNQ